ncbi:hypothetical protein MLD38_024782 [Melastoma candidum]|uniref:Uncharacterized protein n=1 Tax=Melastoma candidum TaxID=119954 RepID=A0ACB9NTG2_9MYRT|nr:hypothetical protein MLD38_024782 [Melastoma candidum]
MGLACCVAAKGTTLPSQTSTEAINRVVIYSPSWSFRWDNRRRVAGEIDDPYDPPEGNTGHPPVPTKESLLQGRGYVSDGRSQVANEGTPISQRSPIHDVIGVRSLTLSSDLSCTSNNSAELKSVPSPESTVPKKSFASTLSSFPKPRAETLSLHIDSFPPNPASSLGQRSPVHQLPGDSEGRTPEMKSPCSNSISEGRPSFVFSPCSNGFSTGSQGDFSDGWSMRTFSELVASSKREREAELKSRSHKIFKMQAVNGFFSGELKSFGYGKVPRSEASSTLKPFLSRRFSLRPKWGMSL